MPSLLPIKSGFPRKNEDHDSWIVKTDHARGEEMHMFPEIDKAAGEKGLMDFDKHDHGEFPLNPATYTSIMSSRPTRKG